jgi:hypothetical protein
MELMVDGCEPDYRDICGFCAELEKRPDNNVLHALMPSIALSQFILSESDNFAIIPAVGSFVDNYVLLVPKSHVLSFGFLPPEVDDEFDSVFGSIVRSLSAEGEGVVAFEHGAESFRNRGGSCTDHAHMHIFPATAALDVREDISAEFEVRQVAPALAPLRHQVEVRKKPYLWMRGLDGSALICDAPEALSQHVRRVIFARMGRPDEWDWAVFPGVEHMTATMSQFALSLDRK